MQEGEEIKLDLRSSFAMKKGGNKQPVTGSHRFSADMELRRGSFDWDSLSRAPLDADLGDRSMFMGSLDDGSWGRWQD